jgi:hypothetical protein
VGQAEPEAAGQRDLFGPFVVGAAVAQGAEHLPQGGA